MRKIDKSLRKALKVATVELCCGDTLLKERLLRAMRVLDSFLGRREEWPPTMYSRAQDISDALKSSDTVDAAIEGMDLSGVQKLAERILHLYAECHSSSE